MSIVYLIASNVDSVYSYRTKNVLKGYAIIPIVISIYFLFQPLVPILNGVTLVNHCILSLLVVISGLALSMSVKAGFSS
jgi:hypothetical protein